MKNKGDIYHDTFDARLREVLASKPVSWWVEKLDIAPSLIPARWKKGAYPGTENIIKICKLLNISANWLLLGIGPKHLDQRRSPIEMSERDREELQKHIYDLRSQLKKEKKKSEDQVKTIMSGAENARALKWVSEVFDLNKDSGAAEQLGNLSGAEISNKIITPIILNLLKSDSRDILKILQKKILSKKGGESLEIIVNWMKQNK